MIKYINLIIISLLMSGCMYSRPDLNKHYNTGMGLSTVSNIYFLSKGDEGYIAFLKSLGVSVVVGLGKEVYDKVSGRGVADWKDVEATVKGGLLGSTLMIPFGMEF
jgi:hypothetical protein